MQFSSSLKPSGLACFLHSVVAQGSLRSSTDQQFFKQFLLPSQRSHRPPELYYCVCTLVNACAADVLARHSNCNVGTCTCIHWLLSGIPVDWRQADVTGGQENHGKRPSTVLLCHVKAPWLKPHLLVWDRIELWPTACYIPSHTAIAELLAVAGLFWNASGPYPHCFLNPYSSYAELLTTHSPWRLLTTVLYTTLSCYIILSSPTKPSWMVCVMCSSILSSSETNKVADTATPSRVTVNISHTSTSFTSSWEDTCSTTTDTSFPHGFWDSTLVRMPHHCILLQQQDFNDIYIPTCHFRRSSSRSLCV